MATKSPRTSWKYRKKRADFRKPIFMDALRPIDAMHEVLGDETNLELFTLPPGRYEIEYRRIKNPRKQPEGTPEPPPTTWIVIRTDKRPVLGASEFYLRNLEKQGLVRIYNNPDKPPVKNSA